MKKLIFTLTVGLSLLIFTTSCKWIHETFYSVEGCAEWYAEEIYDAAVDKDKKEFIERIDQLNSWIEDLSDSDKKRAYKALNKWSKKHEVKQEIIEKYEDYIL